MTIIATVRRVTSDDLPFLALMLAEAAFPPRLDPRPTPEEALADERAGRYLRGWGRQGDLGVIASSPGGAPIGAAWHRLFSAEEPGHGFVDEATPEVAIAVVAEARGRGVGTLLLRALLETAGAAGFPRLSLSVSAHNPAGLALYRGAGFTRVGGDDELPVMLASTKPGSVNTEGR